MTTPRKKAKAKPGRPFSYRKGYLKIIEQMCLAGATDPEIADFLRVSVSTLYNWRHANPELLEAIKTGKSHADERVERSLYQKAIGFERDEVKIFMAAGEPVYAPYRAYYPPDTAAAFQWLKNRRPDKWRDVQQVEHGGPGAFDHLSDEQLVEMVAKEAQLLLEDKSRKQQKG